MLDFNSATLATRKASQSLSAALQERINEALAAERAQEPPREYIGMSELGDECLRRVYYNAERAPRKPFRGASLRAFEAGKLYETMVARWLVLAGFDLRWQQQEIVTADGSIKGHIDGRLYGGPFLPGLSYPAVWENKALGAKYWRPYVKNGLRATEPKYYGQIMLYEGYEDVQCGLFTAINKDTCEIYAEAVLFDLAAAQAYSDGGVTVLDALRAGKPPIRMCPNATFFEAKMCDFSGFCFGDQR